MNAISNTFQQLPAITDGLTTYVNAVNNIPMLSEEEERRLANRLRQDNDTAAARQLALSNLRIVVSVARGYGGYGLDQTDLIQEGNIGLLRAVRKFDPTRGARLATFAVYWIRAEIHEFILRNWRIVKIATTKAQRKLFFNMRRLTNVIGNRRADNAKIAKELNVAPEDVEDMRIRLRSTDAVPFSADENGAFPGAESMLADDGAMAVNPEDALETREKRRVIETALANVSEREREILIARRLSDPPQTLREVAETRGISIERARQIEAAAMKKITRSVKESLLSAAG